MRNKYKRTIAVLLVSALIVTSLSFYAPKTSTETKAKDKKTATVKIVKELKDKRTEYSDTYLLSNGTKRVRIYPGKVRYKEDGNLKEY